MELIVGIVSKTADATHLSKQLRNLSVQMKYVLGKAQGVYQMSGQFKHCSKDYLLKVIKRSQQMELKLDELFSKQNLSIRERIWMSLPFDKTKEQIKELIQELQSGIRDLKQQLQGEPNIIVNGLKRTVQNLALPVSIPLSKEQSISSQVEQDHIAEMGPTLLQDQLSQIKKINFTIKLEGNSDILDAIGAKSKNLLCMNKTIQISDQHQILVYSLSRLDFKPCYAKVKELFPLIDTLSRDPHFRIIWRRTSKENSDRKENHHQVVKGSAKKQQNPNDQFFSFPAQTVTLPHEVTGKIMMINSEMARVTYIRRGQEWVKTQLQTELTNGDQVTWYDIKAQTNQNKKLNKASLFVSIAYSSD